MHLGTIFGGFAMAVLSAGCNGGDWNDGATNEARRIIQNDPQVVQALFELATAPPSFEETGLSLIANIEVHELHVRATKLPLVRDVECSFRVTAGPGLQQPGMAPLLRPAVDARMTLSIERSAGRSQMFGIPGPYAYSSVGWILHERNGVPLPANRP